MRPKKKRITPPRAKKATAAPQYYDSIRAAAGVLGMSVAALMAAKGAGCPAFRSGRVYGAELAAWLETHTLPVATDDGTIAAARLRKVQEEVRKLKLVNDRNAGTVIPRAIVAQAVGKLCAEWNAIRSRSEAEAPAKMAGLEAAECRVVFRGVMDELGAAFEACARFFNEEETESKPENET